MWVVVAISARSLAHLPTGVVLRFGVAIDPTLHENVVHVRYHSANVSAGNFEFTWLQTPLGLNNRFSCEILHRAK